MAVAQATGAELPGSGQIIFGDIERTKRVNVAELVRKTKHIVEQITNRIGEDEPNPSC